MVSATNAGYRELSRRAGAGVPEWKPLLPHQHHLIPDLPSNLYAQIAQRVQAVCATYDLPYTTGPLARQYLLTLHTIFKLALPDRFLTATSDDAPDTAPTGSAPRVDQHNRTLAATGANSLCPVDVVTSQRVNDGHIKPLFIEYEIDHMVTLSGAPPDRHGSRRVSQYQPTVVVHNPRSGRHQRLIRSTNTTGTQRCATSSPSQLRCGLHPRTDSHMTLIRTSSWGPVTPRSPAIAVGRPAAAGMVGVAGMKA